MQNKGSIKKLQLNQIVTNTLKKKQIKKNTLHAQCHLNPLSDENQLLSARKCSLLKNVECALLVNA